MGAKLLLTRERPNAVYGTIREWLATVGDGRSVIHSDWWNDGVDEKKTRRLIFAYSFHIAASFFEIRDSGLGCPLVREPLRLHAVHVLKRLVI